MVKSIDENGKKTVVFMFPMSLTEQDISNFGINYLSQKGYHVYVWNLSPLLNKKLACFISNKKNNITYVHVTNYKYFKNLLMELFDNSVFIDLFVGLSAITWKTEKVYRMLRHYNILYFIVSLAAMPIPNIPKSDNGLIKKIIWKLKHTPSINLKYFLDIISSKFILFLKKHADIYPIPARIFGGDSEIIDLYLKRHNYDKNNITYIHSMDYDRYLDYLERVNYQQPKLDMTCVLLDDMPTNHPDGLLTNTPLVDEKNYFYSMNQLFMKIEKELGLRVIIAAHPRSNYEDMPDVFGGREIIKGKTPDLVAKSSLVIMHNSTSVSFAILFKKPIMVAATSDMNVNVYTMASALRCEVIKVDNDEHMKNLDLTKYKRPNANYDEYLYKYIKSKKAPEKKVWEIVEEELHEII